MMGLYLRDYDDISAIYSDATVTNFFPLSGSTGDNLSSYQLSLSATSSLHATQMVKTVERLPTCHAARLTSTDDGPPRHSPRTPGFWAQWEKRFSQAT